jgi:putative endonuclease
MLTSKYQNSYFYGIISEMFVVLYLSFRGYIILKRRYKTVSGEIDIIAKRGNKISFIEVKSRMKNEQLDYAFTQTQAERIRNAGSIYLSKNIKFRNYENSFDLIKVCGIFVKSHEKDYF